MYVGNTGFIVYCGIAFDCFMLSSRWNMLFSYSYCNDIWSTNCQHKCQWYWSTMFL